jgi:hypothetical protein
MMWASLIFAFFLQAQAATPEKVSVVVGLLDGQQLLVEDPHFTGFIESRDDGNVVLLYREKQFRGEMNLTAIQRIDFSYTSGEPFHLSVTLKNGQKLNVNSDRRDYLIVKGSTETGSVLIQHPDPTSTVVRMSSRKTDRRKDLTIQYLEFPR